MRIFAIETSAKAASVCITEDGKLISQYFQNTGLTHSRTVLQMAEDMLKSTELTVQDMDVIAAAKGPGSFTGIRIGVAAAKGLAWAADKKMCGVSTLEAMAFNAFPAEGEIICAVMDARRGQVYSAVFKNDGGSLIRLCPDRAISIQELIKDLEEAGGVRTAVGDGADILVSAGKEAGLRVAAAPENIKMQAAYGVALAAAKSEPEDDIIPNYLRLSQAERERLEHGGRI